MMQITAEGRCRLLENKYKGGDKVRKFRRIALSLVLAVVLLLAVPLATMAANPTVAITVTAQVVSITNTESTWAIGVVAVDAVVYFSATGEQDDDYSMITNTGSVACDVEIQGTDIDGGDYDWTLAAAATNQTYQLYANTEGAPTVYDVEVKSSSYVDLTTDLAVDATWDWSMEFTAPDEFSAADDGGEKTATVTLVASKHV